MSAPHSAGFVVKVEQGVPSCAPLTQAWKAPTFKCEFCDDEYKVHRLLMRHQAESHQVPLVTIKSDESSSSGTVSSSSQGQRRFISHPSAIGPDFDICPDNPGIGRREEHFQCDLCNRTYKTEAGFTKHQRDRHSDVRPFPCSLC
eukprot:354413_1